MNGFNLINGIAWLRGEPPKMLLIYYKRDNVSDWLLYHGRWNGVERRDGVEVNESAYRKSHYLCEKWTGLMSGTSAPVTTNARERLGTRTMASTGLSFGRL
jgi:hypothetical protein